MLMEGIFCPLGLGVGSFFSENQWIFAFALRTRVDRPSLDSLSFAGRRVQSLWGLYLSWGVLTTLTHLL